MEEMKVEDIKAFSRFKPYECMMPKLNLEARTLGPKGDILAWLFQSDFLIPNLIICLIKHYCLHWYKNENNPGLCKLPW